jgi:hypothetical protein
MTTLLEDVQFTGRQSAWSREEPMLFSGPSVVNCMDEKYRAGFLFTPDDRLLMSLFAGEVGRIDQNAEIWPAGRFV